MAKGIMIQGTMSGAGKSFLVAGLLRILKEDGYRAAPFKSQNMALNSYITRDGLEIGRAQAMQAEAAGTEASVDMNPILLKPTNDVGSQVIVNGEVLGNMKARDYFAYKEKLIPDILAAYERLGERYDVIVIEGAGSPAEINLKQNDIVNMGLAEMLDVPVLLAGDIDRGGVFAQLYGTVALLTKAEQERIKGLLINKFRGDRTILEPGIEMLERLTGKPVLGTIPYMKVELEEEDSLSEKLDGSSGGGHLSGAQPPARIRIRVIRFPRLSNYTDLAPLEHIPDVEVSYVTRPEELRNADLIVLPGSKNTMGDLKWFRESGMEAAVLKQYAADTPVVGICGGFQILGEEIADPEGVEEGGRIRGMGLLPMQTTFSRQKERTRVTGILPKIENDFALLSRAAYEGYEIHMGTSVYHGKCGEEPVIWEQEGRMLGMSREHVFGTYVHGILDREEVAAALLQMLAQRRGIDLEIQGIQDFAEYKEQQYRQLAKELRANLDMEAVYRLLGLEER